MLSAFFVVAMRLAGLPLAVVCAADDLPGGTEVCVASQDGSHDSSDASLPLELDDDSDDDEAAHGSAPLMAPPSPRVDVPVREAAVGLGCGALAEQLALSSHTLDLDRPPRA